MKQYIIFLFSLCATLGFAQEKTLHLAHGLGGSEDSWDAFDEFIQLQCSGIQTTSFQMTSNEGLDTYSEEFIDQLEQFGATSNDIAIGHSFGGINLRNIDTQGTENFGGYITVGSAHGGAYLANSFKEGRYSAFIRTACEDVIVEPIVALLDLLPFIGGLAGYIESQEDLICNGIDDALLNSASMFLGNGDSVEELTITGTVPNLPSAVLPAVGVVCTTEGHPLWSLLEDSSFIDLDLSNTSTIMSDLETYLRTTSVLLRTISNFNFIPSKNFRTKLRRATDACIGASQWIQSSGPVWNQLIGAGGDVTFVVDQETNWVCHCWDETLGMPVPCDNNGGFAGNVELTEIGQLCTTNPDCWETQNIMVPIFGPDLPSDGLVTTESQSLPGAFHEEYISEASHFDQPSNSGVHICLLNQLKPNTAPDFIFQFQNCL